MPRLPIKNGPYGTSLSLLNIIAPIAYGIAKRDDKIIATRPNFKPNIMPITMANFISPPPKASLLKINFPIFPIRSINANNTMPLKMLKPTSFIPK